MSNHPWVDVKQEKNPTEKKDYIQNKVRAKRSLVFRKRRQEQRGVCVEFVTLSVTRGCLTRRLGRKHKSSHGVR